MRHRRKLLVAAVGLATINYAACGAPRGGESSGNLMPPPEDTAITETGFRIDTATAETDAGGETTGDASDGG